MPETLITKYRPKTFDEVIGQTSIVRSLAKVIKDKSSRTFLFTGPAGTGKTTLARLVAEAMGCGLQDLQEIDGATYRGIDDMRAITAGLQYKPIGESAVKAVIVDECHAISKDAFQSLLKSLEDVPSWVVWLLCTTEPTKVPKAIVTRSTHYSLKLVSTDELLDWLDPIAEKEGIVEEVAALCAKEAEGSPRQALANLAACGSAKNVAEAKQLLRSAVDSAEAIALVRALVQGADWKQVQKLLAGLSDVNPESVRHIVRAYVSKVVLNSKSQDEAGYGIEILDAFSQPFHSSDGIAPLIVACGKVVFR